MGPVLCPCHSCGSPHAHPSHLSSLILGFSTLSTAPDSEISAPNSEIDHSGTTTPITNCSEACSANPSEPRLSPLLASGVPRCYTCVALPFVEIYGPESRRCAGITRMETAPFPTASPHRRLPSPRPRIGARAPYEPNTASPHLPSPAAPSTFPQPPLCVCTSHSESRTSSIALPGFLCPLYGPELRILGRTLPHVNLNHSG